jgi:hypothetical protein
LLYLVQFAVSPFQFRHLCVSQRSGLVGVRWGLPVTDLLFVQVWLYLFTLHEFHAASRAGYSGFVAAIKVLSRGATGQPLESWEWTAAKTHLTLCADSQPLPVQAYPLTPSGPYRLTKGQANLALLGPSVAGSAASGGTGASLAPCDRSGRVLKLIDYPAWDSNGSSRIIYIMRVLPRVAGARGLQHLEVKRKGGPPAAGGFIIAASLLRGWPQKTVNRVATRAAQCGSRGPSMGELFAGLGCSLSSAQLRGTLHRCAQLSGGNSCKLRSCAMRDEHTGPRF